MGARTAPSCETLSGQPYVLRYLAIYP